MVRINCVAALLAVSFSTALAAPGSFFSESSLISARQNQNSGKVTTVNAGANAIGKGNGGQFTVGGCINDADCGSGCCAGGAVSGSTGRAGVGVCSGKGGGVEFQKGKTGCGFQDPNAQLTLQEAADQVKKQGF
ncbi:biotrophy-associated secreted protein 2 [Colletotrichum truncatum]|uniref:Biotrophy-associated secreted protein 2 n=1 Tax=Colletotrichum truncatum TaxID=5467 RepID=A0ACC3ZL57_COLTU|nr:biotrophy-associated secreted protein 2 [Colletotrichum truncatum]KAF6786901.1 biotrophy-associated secreted protein 2 [Colletotrichum truncatum]